MDLVLAACPDEFALRALDRAVFTAADLLVKRSPASPPLLAAFPAARLRVLDRGAWTFVKSVIAEARRERAGRLLYLSPRSPTVPNLIALFLMACVAGARAAIYTADGLSDVRAGAVFARAIVSLSSPVIALLLLPRFVVKEVLGHFLARIERADEPFLAFSRTGRLGGMVYWYTHTNRARKHGLLGYSFAELVGVPATLYTFPVAVLLLSKLRFRWTFCLGLLLAGTALYSFCAARDAGGSPIVLAALVVLPLLSNVVWEHVSLGVYEMIAWGFGLWSVATFPDTCGAASGALLGLAVMSHAGVAALVVTFLGALAAASGAIVPLLTAGAVTFLVSWPWLVPFVLSQREVTRGRMLNEEYFNVKEFGAARLVELALSTAFLIAQVLTTSDGLAIALAALPVPVAYANVKVGWVFSPYTVRAYQALAALLSLGVAFSPWSFAVLLGYLFLPPSVLSWEYHEDRFDYSLDPSPRRDAVDRCAALFAGLDGSSRVAFESGSKRGGWVLGDQYLSVLLSWYLTGTDVEVFNTGMVELVKYDLFKKTCASWNAIAEPGEVRKAIDLAAITHMVAYSPGFKERLEACGCRLVRSVRLAEQVLSEVHEREAALYAVPAPSARATPPARIVPGRSSLALTFGASGDHRLVYGYHRGLVCRQGARALAIEPDEDGFIRIRDAAAGDAILAFRWSRLFRRARASV